VRNVRELVRDRQGKLYLLDTDSATTVRNTPERSPQTPPEVALQRWRSTYASHYKEQDERAVGLMCESTEEALVTPVGYSSIESCESPDSQEADPIFTPQLRASAEYWNVVAIRSNQSVIEYLEKVARIDQRPAFLGSVAIVSWKVFAGCLLVGVVAGVARWQLDRSQEQWRSFFIDVASMDGSIHDNGDSVASLPGRRPEHAFVDGLAMLTFTIVTLALLLKLCVLPYGLLRLVWWPLSDLLSLWG
jgi:hypothetical protein